MNNDVFDEKSTREFGKFIKKTLNNEDDRADIYCELIKQLMLKSCCAN